MNGAVSKEPMVVRDSKESIHTYKWRVVHVNRQQQMQPDTHTHSHVHFA